MRNGQGSKAWPQMPILKCIQFQPSSSDSWITGTEHRCPAKDTPKFHTLGTTVILQHLRN